MEAIFKMRGGHRHGPWHEGPGQVRLIKHRHGGPEGPEDFEHHGPPWGRHGGPDEGPVRVEYHRRGPWGGHRVTRAIHTEPWGRGGGPKVGRGDVRAAILLLLADRPMHGYQIIQEIGEWSGGLWRPSPGSVYPALQLLEDEGLVRAEQESERRVFHLTDAGRAYVETHRAELVAARDAVTGNVDDAVLELRDLHQQVGIALMQVARAGTPSQIAEARTLLTNARRQLYRILADEPASEPERS